MTSVSAPTFGLKARVTDATTTDPIEYADVAVADSTGKNISTGVVADDRI